MDIRNDTASIILVVIVYSYVDFDSDIFTVMLVSSRICEGIVLILSSLVDRNT